MRKVLALMLAAVMLLTLNVGALAEETASDIVAYGGGDEEGYVVSKLGAPEFFPTIDIRVGDSVQLAVYHIQRDVNPVVYTLYTGEVIWSTKDEDYVTVSEDGLVTAVSTEGWEDGIVPVQIDATLPAGTITSGAYAGYAYDYNTRVRVRVLAEDAVDPSDSYENGNFTIYLKGQTPDIKDVGYAYPTFKLQPGQTLQLGAYVYYYNTPYHTVKEIRPYNGQVKWSVREEGADEYITISSDGLVTVIRTRDGEETSWFRVQLDVPAAKKNPVECNIEVTTKPTTDPGDSEDPNKPTNPDQPQPPVVDSGAASDDRAPQATDNAANDDKTADDLRAGKAVEVKVTNGASALSTETANLLGGGSGKLTLVNGGMTVVLPGGFGKVTEAGRIYYPFDYEQNPRYASDMLAAVKGENVKSEAVKAGGVMTLPTTATVTLKTRLTGTVNVYLYNEYTGKFTLVASPVAKDGTVTFTTRQMGYFLLTTGRV